MVLARDTKQAKRGDKKYLKNLASERELSGALGVYLCGDEKIVAKYPESKRRLKTEP